MSFYLKPPRGNIHFHKLQECVNERLICYDNIYKNDCDISKHYCLIEDTHFDRTGHFMLRVAAFSSISFQREFLTCEVLLLDKRLIYYNERDVRNFLKTLLRQIKDVTKAGFMVNDTFREYFGILKEVCLQQLNKKYNAHIFSNSHKGDRTCEQFIIKVPFYYCSKLVSNREVTLQQGKAEIPCHKWKLILLSLYEYYLKLVLNETIILNDIDRLLQDDRIKNILEIVKSHKCHYSSVNISTFDLKNIDNESKLFPLCMQHLYKMLIKNNRLPHEARFDLSLYMKGIGVSLNDSLIFWERMYSKEHASCSKCTHNWQENERRYIYGIRHLYGLEGSRKNYNVRSCSYLQEKSLGPTEEGGCPFKHFDDDNLRRALKTILPNHADEIEVMIYERKDSPKESCLLFYENVLKSISKKEECSQPPIFDDPVQYYLTLKSDISSFV